MVEEKVSQVVTRCHLLVTRAGEGTEPSAQPRAALVFLVVRAAAISGLAAEASCHACSLSN